MVRRTAFVSRHGQSPGRAALFLNYLLSAAGQRVLSETSHLFPVRRDISGPSIPALSNEARRGARAVRMSPGLLVYVDRLKRDKVLRRWADAVNTPGGQPVSR